MFSFTKLSLTTLFKVLFRIILNLYRAFLCFEHEEQGLNKNMKNKKVSAILTLLGSEDMIFKRFDRRYDVLTVCSSSTTEIDSLANLSI